MESASRGVVRGASGICARPEHACAQAHKIGRQPTRHEEGSCSAQDTDPHRKRDSELRSEAAAATKPRTAAGAAVGSKDAAESCQSAGVSSGADEGRGGQNETGERWVTKGDVRQRLALVSGCYPNARPTRGSLKQVFNFFQRVHADGMMKPSAI